MNLLKLLAVAGLLMTTLHAGAVNQTPPASPIVYSCMRDGIRHYMSSYPKPTDSDCRAITYIRKEAPRPVGASGFHGYVCKSDCSGHRAGYEWAQRRGASGYTSCTGNSQSFIEGCRAYVDQMNSRAAR